MQIKAERQCPVFAKPYRFDWSSPVEMVTIFVPHNDQPKQLAAGTVINMRLTPSKTSYLPRYSSISVEIFVSYSIPGHSFKFCLSEQLAHPLIHSDSHNFISTHPLRQSLLHTTQAFVQHEIMASTFGL
jgi:hypothetical protein